jgi:hypothetical protein
MSEPVICHGCGQRVPVPAGYRRRKLQCGCGVIVELSDDALAAAAAPPPPSAAPARTTSRAEFDRQERWAADLLGASDPAPPPAAPEPADEADLPRLIPEESPEQRRQKRETTFTCRRCGGPVRRQRECPACDAPAGEPPPRPAADTEDEDDGSPYDIHGGADVPCPKCTNFLPPGSLFCTRCGYDFRRRKKRVKTYQPLSASWETNMALKRRLTIWGVLQGLNLAATLTLHAYVGLDPAGLVLSWIGFAAMTAFLMGTFDRIDLERDTRGRVKLTRTRRLCFFIASVTPIDVQGYEGVATGRSSEVTGWEWMVFLFLLISGVIPGLVWWYLVIHKITFHVDLTRDHGYPEMMVYRGWSEAQMRDIARVLSDASGLKCQGV